MTGVLFVCLSVIEDKAVQNVDKDNKMLIVSKENKTETPKKRQKQ